eukprot:maker-scaffold_4-snap-gene-11.5-mRNA-1 protein AED:0.01 eAED:0.01 QI:115/1/1/1/1/1/2/881/429
MFKISDIPADSDFSIHNLPYGIFSTDFLSNRVGVAISDQIIDMQELSRTQHLQDLPRETLAALQEPVLNTFMNLTPKQWNEVRNTLKKLLESGLETKFLVPQAEVQMHLPCKIGDYTDFYSSLPHAFNVGTLFRGKGNELQPNYLHLPVGYHGRASTVQVSGSPVHRPIGQLGAETFGKCKALDIELEMGVFVGNQEGLKRFPTAKDSEDCIFGFVLLNDWSARDIQRWEYVPLGPFNGKNFATTISPWIVTLAAMKEFEAPTVYHPSNRDKLLQREEYRRIKFPAQLPYLQEHKGKQDMSYDLKLQVLVKDTQKSEEYKVVSESNYRNMYWSARQQIAHHTVGGCELKGGDLLGSGTISGFGEKEYGSFLELTWNRTKKVSIGGGERTYLEDYDSVVLKGYCENKEKGIRIGFGSCEGTIYPPHKGNL